MKKQIVALVALVLAATPALALINNSGHDIPFSLGGANTEICVYCHTPHGATATPLWNRAAGTAAMAPVYSSVTLNATMPADYSATDAPLCMSCHDGATQMDAVVNPPNAGGALSSGVVAGTANLADGGWANDHPIGFVYATAIANGDLELNAAPTVPLFGGEVWCSSCHDVHNSGAGTYALLQLDNAGSNLCFDCHNK